MKKLTPSKADALWSKRAKLVENALIEIEEMAEQGSTCVKLISEKLGVSEQQANAFVAKLVKSGALVKCKDKMRIGGEPRTMYQIAGAEPWQAKLIHESPPARDWLVAAFFGERTCVTP